MYSPVSYGGQGTQRAGYAFLYHRSADPTVLDILFSVIIACLMAAITFLPIVAA